MAGPTGNAQDGLDAAGVTPPTGGDGIRGWLSGSYKTLTDIYNRLGGTLTVALSSSSPLDVSDRSARLLGHVTVDNTITVANFPATQPVSGTVSVTGTVPVSGTFWQATQPVSGTVTSAQGTAAATAGAWPVKNTDGTNTATVTAASTAAVAANSGLVVALHPTSPLPAGASVIGALTANQSVNNAQVNGSAVVTSVTGVQDVMPRKRTASTGLSPNYSASHITTNATTTPTAATAYISTILIVVSGIGTAWTIKIQNKEATPKIIYPATTAALGTVQFNFTEPILATSGIDIVTAGTTAGTVDVYVTYWQ